MTEEPRTGRVVVVGTPIGNLADLSQRAVETLRDADVICCEDTRRTRILLSACGIPSPRLVAVHRHNEAAGAASVVAMAAGGAVVAVVSDAGMPGVSDPGQRLVGAAVAAGVPVSVVPGPTAAASAAVLSGFASTRWCFEGFLPRKGRDRADRLAAVASDARPSVIYEAPHRVAVTVADLAGACGPERPVALARELTKLHEEVWRGRLAEAVGHLAGGEARGEWVIVVGGAPAAAPATDADVTTRLAERVAAGDDRRSAVGAVARELGVPRRRVYDLAVRARNQGGAAAGDG